MNFEIRGVNITERREERVKEGNPGSLPLVDGGIVEGMKKHSQGRAGELGRAVGHALREPRPPRGGSGQGIWILRGTWWALKKSSC